MQIQEKPSWKLWVFSEPRYMADTLSSNDGQGQWAAAPPASAPEVTVPCHQWSRETKCFSTQDIINLWHVFQGITPLEECLYSVCSSLGIVLLFNLSYVFHCFGRVCFPDTNSNSFHLSWSVVDSSIPGRARSLPAAFASSICTEAPGADLMTSLCLGL